jgi:hypothetical protein
MHIESQMTYLTSSVRNNLGGDRCDAEPGSDRLLGGAADDSGLPIPKKHLLDALQ